MHVRVLCFGVLKDWLGAATATVELPEGATVAALLEVLRKRQSTDLLQKIAVSVNAQFATAAQVLHEGDEDKATTALTRQPIDAERLMAAVKQGEDGAVVVFDGIVRNNSRGRQTLYLDYEAYEEMAAKQMRALAAEVRTRFGVRQVTLIHRLGRLAVGETSVFIAVASAHRAQAFEACRWLIDTLKKTVPIWKKETFADGAVWADGEPFPAGLAVEPEASNEG